MIEQYHKQTFSLRSNMDIPYPNCTNIPTVIFDYWMPKLTAQEFVVLMILAYETFRYRQVDERKDNDAVSKQLIAEKTGLELREVENAIKVLAIRGIVINCETFAVLDLADPEDFDE